MENTNEFNAGLAVSAAVFFAFSASFVFPCRVSAAEAAYQELSSQAAELEISALAVPAASPAAVPSLQKMNKAGSGKDAAITNLSDAELAASTLGQKVEMLQTLISRSHPNPHPGRAEPDPKQKGREEAIIRILTSARDAASF